MTDESLNVVQDEEVPEACLYYVTLKTYEREDECFRNEKGEKSIIVSAQEVMGINSNDTWVGEYVNCGPLAFKSETFGGVNPFKPGDYIVYKNHRSVKVGYNGKKYVTVSHHDLYNKVKNPDKFKAI